MEFARRSLIAVVLGALIALIVLMIVVAAHALLVIFAGLLLAVLLRALAAALARRTGLPSRGALWLVVVLLFGAIGTGGWLFAAEIARQFQDLGSALLDYWQQFEHWLSRFGWGREVLRLLSDSTSSEKVDVLGRFLGGILATLSTLVIALFVGLYVAARPERYRSGLLRLVPLRHQADAEQVLDTLGSTLRGWLVGTLINMTVIGVATTLGLWLLGIPLALALGLLAFLLEFIPFLGPIVAAVPAILVAMTVGPAEAAYTALLYLAVQQFEEYLLVPYVYQRSAHLAPAVTISAQVVLGTLLGVLGLVFATPLVACGKVLLDELYVRRALGNTQGT